MLRRIPTISPIGMKIIFDSINSKPSFYEDFKDVGISMLLELALLELKIFEQICRSNDTLTVDTKME